MDTESAEPMKWTKSKPITAGYYWVKAHTLLSGTTKAFIVKVYCRKKNKLPDTVFWDGENFNLDCDCERFMMWSDEQIREPQNVV